MELVFPIKAIIFQVLFLMVAIALEAMVLRQRLRLGYKVSIQYAATLNFLATGIGWMVFLGLEPFAPPELRTQVISFIFFNRFYDNDWSQTVGVTVLLAGLIMFFATLWLKLNGLKWLMQLLELPLAEDEQRKVPILSRREKYRKARKRELASAYQQPMPNRAIAVLHANALSFTVILVLLALRWAIEVG